MGLGKGPWPAAGAIRPDGGGWRSGFACGPAVVDAGGNDPADGVWLASALAPWCDRIDPPPAPVRVRVIRSDARSDALERRRIGRAMTPVSCFGLDTRTIVLPGWHEGDRLWLADSVADCFLGIAGGSVDIVGRPGRRTLRLALMRVMRELIAAPVLAAGRTVDLHAAAFSVAGKGVLLAGPKGAGKTTLLCHALLTGGAALLSNDRAFVTAGATAGVTPGMTGAVVTGVPTTVAIRPQTRALFPQLRDGHPAEGGAGPMPPAPLLTPVEFAERLGCAHVRDAAVHAVLLPERHSGADGWSHQRLTEEEAFGRLERCRYGIACGRREPTVLAALAAGPDGAVASGEPLRRLVAAVPVYRCRIGPTLYEEPAMGWLGALGLAGATA